MAEGPLSLFLIYNEDKPDEVVVKLAPTGATQNDLTSNQVLKSSLGYRELLSNIDASEGSQWLAIDSSRLNEAFTNAFQILATLRKQD